MYVPDRSSTAYQLDMYIEQKPDKKAEAQKRKMQRVKAIRRRLTIYMAVFFVALFVVILRSVRINDLHNDVLKQTSVLEDLQTQNERTKLEIENLTDMSKIQNYAETELGLKKVTSAQIIYLNPVRENYMKNMAKDGDGKFYDTNGDSMGILAYSK